MDITIIVKSNKGRNIAHTKIPEVAEMELDRLIREHYTCDDCGLDECEEDDYPPEFDDDMDEWEEEKIARRRDKQRKIINNYKKNA